LRDVQLRANGEPDAIDGRAGKWEKPRMRAVVVGILALSAVGISCGSPNYGDAGNDPPPFAAMTFDVSSSGGDAAPMLCPGMLFVTVSQSPGNATCTSAPEECVGSQDPAANTIVCDCHATSGSTGAGVWTCRQPNH
jgi:hypothetical protein